LLLSDMVFAAVYKVYVGFSSRRFTSDLQDAFVEGHIGSTPHFNSVNRYISDPQLTDVLKELITASSAEGLEHLPYELFLAIVGLGYL